jgi:hypothetical protein
VAKAGREDEELRCLRRTRLGSGIVAHDAYDWIEIIHLVSFVILEGVE